MKKRILVTGAAGYIGTDLVRSLLHDGYSVIALDRVYFGQKTIEEFEGNPDFKLIKKDSRDIEYSDLEGCYAVCDLVALSNDPSGELNPELTRQINFESRVRTAEMAKRCGVNRYILSSSCSVYGAGANESLTEKSPLNPLTVYSKSARDAEEGVLGLNSEDFSVTVIRNATVFGLSNRMRFDLVVNLMVCTAFEEKQIIVTGGGNQWRPLVHLHDISRAIVSILSQNTEKVSGEIFNIGLENVQIKPLAYRIRQHLGGNIDVVVISDDADRRDYNIDFGKAKRELNFVPEVTIETGIDEIWQALIAGKVSRNDRTSTVKWYQRLQEAQELFQDLNIDGKIF